MLRFIAGSARAINRDCGGVPLVEGPDQFPRGGGAPAAAAATDGMNVLGEQELGKLGPVAAGADQGMHLVSLDVGLLQATDSGEEPVMPKQDQESLRVVPERVQGLGRHVVSKGTLPPPDKPAQETEEEALAAFYLVDFCGWVCSLAHVGPD